VAVAWKLKGNTSSPDDDGQTLDHWQTPARRSIRTVDWDSDLAQLSRPGQAVALTIADAAALSLVIRASNKGAEGLVYNLVPIPPDCSSSSHRHRPLQDYILRSSLRILTHLSITFKMKWLLALLPLVAASPIELPNVNLGDAPPPGQVSTTIVASSSSSDTSRLPSAVSPMVEPAALRAP
jgi:hypothetical protein